MMHNDTHRLPLATLFLSAALPMLPAQDIETTPFGQPSGTAAGQNTLSLSLTAGPRAALRLEGGAPGATAILLFGSEQRATPMPGGGTLLIARVLRQHIGAFDAHGCFLHPVDLRSFPAEGRLCVQGMQPGTGARAEFSAGLELLRRADAPAPASGRPQPPQQVLVTEVAGLMRAGHLAHAMQVALNSAGDALTLDIEANLEVPVFAGVTAGGKAAFKAMISRGEDTAGAVVYDLEIGSDVAASAGVGIGVAGIGASKGAGASVSWRFASTHEVARAIRSMAILQAVAEPIETACLSLSMQLERIEEAVATARRTADRVRRAARSRGPWRNSALARRIQSQRDRMIAQRRAHADKIRRAVGKLIGWVATERIFLLSHAHGFSLRQTVTATVSAGTGLGDAKAGGEMTGANVGASIAAGVQQQLTLHAEFVPGSQAVAFSQTRSFERSIAGAAGLGVGVAAAGKRVIELTTRMQMSTAGLQADGDTTVKVTLDGKLLAALGAFVSVPGGVGGDVSIELSLEDLLGYGKDALGVLLGDDDNRAARMLLSLPIRVCARGRYEAGFTAGFGIDVDGAFKGGFSASAMMTDYGQAVEYAGGEGASSARGETLRGLLIQAIRGATLDSRCEAVTSRLSEVTRQCAAVRSR